MSIRIRGSGLVWFAAAIRILPYAKYCAGKILVRVRGSVRIALLGYVHASFAQNQRQVEPYGEVRVAAAALEIEHLQCMPADIKSLRDIVLAMYFYDTGREIDRSGNRLMDTTDIQCQFIIHKYPQIIITGELVDNIVLVAALIFHLPVFWNLKVYGHAHAEMVVQILVVVHGRLCLMSIIIMEREEADRLCVCTTGATRIL